MLLQKDLQGNCIECLIILSKRNGMKEKLLSTCDTILCKEMSDSQNLSDLFKFNFEAAREHRSPQLTKHQNFFGIVFFLYFDLNQSIIRNMYV